MAAQIVGLGKKPAPTTVMVPLLAGEENPPYGYCAPRGVAFTCAPVKRLRV